ncbi:shikimate dehydrogenase [Halalkaliarchaeum desulfuricum]|uniref:Shikimate dehydrogenase (NADP(+)) n=1 Tax=Halalkaliarchaeum desulfuricum TaxID=2055893 RepID=A0A343TGL7_9EURY|nr:shikimate dehydrogenase [Halalkaliarchaeum desulfuricum]AUX08239.1 shikimate dehydrogenase [Halalkaliarchaeum desulfuricum]
MQVYGLVGNPVGHSLSPPMHEAAYDACGLDARYVTFEPDVDRIEAAIEGAAALGIEGINVTIPFKEDALAAVEADDLAARVGAVNTIDFTEAGPRGYNTDTDGVRRAFAHHDVGLCGAEAVVVGAGGAGRAAAFALADAGAAVHVANRTPERAASLADAAGMTTDRVITAGGLDTLPETVPEADVLVNATSVGMESDETPVDGALLHSGLAVLDAVYRPLETRLLRDAAAAGATTIDGAWMLLYQGVEAFEIWTDKRAPVSRMNEALRSHL